MLQLMRFGVYFETKTGYFHKEIIIVYLHSYMLGARRHMIHEKILKIWYSLVRFGVYLIRLYLEKLIFLYIKISIMATRLL